jgi:TPR repeat protein
LKLVAEQGKSDAYLILGLAYMNIKDIPRDLVQADMWLNLAARATRSPRHRLFMPNSK